MRIVAVLVAAVCLLPVHVQAQLRAQVVASGFDHPLAFVPDPVFPDVFYVVQQGGIVRTVRGGQLQSEPFVDLRGMVFLFAGEQGLLGMAFAPDAASGRVFFNFTDANGDTVIARFRRTAANPFTVDKSTRFDLRWPTGERAISRPDTNHNGGNLVFGPDGFLYIALGDGGSGGPPSQDPMSLLGKILRIDVNVPDSDATGYRVPADNPFVDGQPIQAFTEIWALGLRNPWRYSFDDFGPGATGALVLADVGQSTREEINYEPRGAGGRNYGWPIREGRVDINNTTPQSGPLTDPIFDYGRADGRAVMGGYVYRGQALAAAYRGRYFFADFEVSRVWSLELSVDPSTGEAMATGIIDHTSELGGSATLGNIASFGRDLQGELYFVTFAGRVVKIVPDGNAPPGAPQDVTGIVTGSTVTISWRNPASGTVPVRYQLEAGFQPGRTDQSVITTGAQTSLTFAGVPPGTYFVRIRSLSQSRASAASNEITVVVAGGGCSSAPPAPAALAATVNGRNVTLNWNLPTTANGPTSFSIEAGSVSGAANLATLPVDGNLRLVTVSAPPGRYFVRIRARNGCGTSNSSNEIVIIVF